MRVSSRRRGLAEARVLALFFLLLMALTVAGFVGKNWLPPLASAHGKGVDAMIAYLLLATGTIFVVGHSVLAAFLWRYSGDAPPSGPRVKPRVEWVWALFPALVMAAIAEGGGIVLGLPVLEQVYGPPPADAFVVEVVGKQFEWLVRYPGKDGKFGRVEPRLVNDRDNPLGLDEKDPAATDDLVLRGTLHLPVGRAVVVRLRSLDVLHSFSVPEFRVKQDLIPGFTARSQFVVERAGTYEIACAELCGLGHYRMRGFVQVKPAEEFARWLDAQIGWFE
ncbi:MAG: cytochrome-c oxidase [Planctomycetes bacterium]|nr:cytochrome-c oxidase [Planctomycetota bacterium]